MTDQSSSSSALARLLELSGQSEPNAFESLYRVVSPQLYGMLLSMLNNTDAASDALKRTFADIWVNGAGYRPDLGSPMSWLSHVARGHAVSMLRQHRQNTGQSWVYSEHDVDVADEDLDLSLSSNSAVDNALVGSGQSTEVQQMIRGAYLQGASTDELAHHYQMTPAQVKDQLRGWLMDMRSQIHG